MKEILWIFSIPVFLFCLFFVIFFPIISGVGYYTCHARWDNAGYKDVSWGPIKGCLITLNDGRQIPSNKITRIDYDR